LRQRALIEATVLFKEAGAASMSKMQKRHPAIVTILVAQLGIWPASCPAWAAQKEIKAGNASVDLELGTTTTIEIARPFSRVLIGDPHVIDFESQGECALLLRPQGVGSTNLVIVDKKGIVITNLTIFVRDAGAI
jgi:Flp pilus assembly secretin CpaC